MQSIGRRRAIGLIATSASALLIPARAAASKPSRIDAARLQKTLEQLSVFGRPTGGTFADGVSRTAYSDADIAGRAYVMGLMRDASLAPRIDAAGNIIGRRAGTDRRLKPIMIGSHIDTVRSGGNFDGNVGSLGGLEVLRTLADNNIATRHPIELAIWSNEEGITMGSTAFAGLSLPDVLEQTSYGVTIRDGLKRIGGDPDRLAEVRRSPGSIAAYLELHIEQGGVLEKSSVPIGIVDGIVGIKSFAITVTGFANHAGTTPMAERHNALLAAAKLVEAVDEEVKRVPGRQVGTVGQLNVFPNAPNVVPGRVELTVEFRDLAEPRIDMLAEAVQRRAQDIAKATGTEIGFRPIDRLASALATPTIQRAIEVAAAGLGLGTMHLPSGAGHDAQNLATLAPMGMIFVPSIGGISHSPRELSRWVDCANGANVLLNALLIIDRGLA